MRVGPLAKPALDQQQLVIQEVVQRHRAFPHRVVGLVRRRQHPHVANLKVGDEVLRHWPFHRQHDLAIAAGRFGRRIAQRFDQPAHVVGHPAAGNGRVLVVGGKAREAAAAGVLVEELDPVQAHVDHFLDEVHRDLAGQRRAHTAGIARPPHGVPILAPRLALVGAADAARPLVLQVVIFAVVAAPEVAGHPARAVAERADMPAALARQRRKFTQRRLAAHRWETIRVHPRPRSLPGHDHRRHRRGHPLGHGSQQRQGLGVWQEFGFGQRRPQVQLALQPHDDVRR